MKKFENSWWETPLLTRHFRSVLSCSKNTIFRAYCLPVWANTRLVWSAYGLHTIMPTELSHVITLVIAWFESMTRLESRFLVTRLESRWEKRWLDSSHVFHKMTRARLESESFLQNLWVPHGQTQFVCTQRNEHVLFQWWSKLEEIFCFACLVVLCCIL